MDHHYVYPHDGGDLFAAQVSAARRIGLRFHPTRGSMDLGESQGGLPPDSIVEDTDAALAATEQAIDDWHDPAPGSMLRVAVAPCSPFSVTPRLMAEAAELARRRGVRLHTHLAETVEEEEFCRKTHDCAPVEYAERLGWLGDDVWLAHGVHLDASAIGRLGATRTGVAHCPSSNGRLGAGIAPVRDLLDAGARVNLRDEDGRTALMFAAGYGRLEIVELLLRAGAKVNAQSKSGATALMEAAREGATETVRALLLAGADVSLRDEDGHSALWHARDNEHDETASLLLAFGAYEESQK
jgi:hypothetical protein